MYDIIPPLKSDSKGGFDFSLFGWFNSIFAVASLLHKDIQDVRRMGLEMFILTDVYNKCQQYTKINNEH